MGSTAVPPDVGRIKVTLAALEVGPLAHLSLQDLNPASASFVQSGSYNGNTRVRGVRRRWSARYARHARAFFAL